MRGQLTPMAETEERKLCLRADDLAPKFLSTKASPSNPESVFIYVCIIN